MLPLIRSSDPGKGILVADKRSKGVRAVRSVIQGVIDRAEKEFVAGVHIDVRPPIVLDNARGNGIAGFGQRHVVIADKPE